MRKKTLVDERARYLAKDRLGNTPFRYAVLRENVRLVEMLLGAGVNVNSRDSFKRTPLHYAAQYNKKPSVIKILLDAGANIEATDKLSSTPLHNAAEYGVCENVRVLLGAGAKVNHKGIGFTGRDTPLHEAANSNSVPVVQALIEGGADLDAPGMYGRTPIFDAAWNRRYPEMLKTLLDAGANADARDEMDESLLYYAVREKNIGLVKVLLKEGADVNTPFRGCYTQGRSPLHLVSKYNAPIVIARWLLDAGAYLEPQDAYGQTPLHLAVRKKKIGLVKMLLKEGANTDAPDDYRQTPLHKAVEKAYNPDVITRWLLYADANANAQDDCGETPLHLAAKGRYVKPPVVAANIEALLDAGGRPRSERQQGQDPLGSCH